MATAEAQDRAIWRVRRTTVAVRRPIDSGTKSGNFARPFSMRDPVSGRRAFVYTTAEP